MKTHRHTRLRVELLEDRCVPAIYNVPWPDPQHLTLSFVPDGTQVRDQTSNLFAFLNATAATSVWQREILRAFQTWAVNANVNIGLQTDGGQPLGADGATQGDSRFGDVRISAWNPGTNQLSTASPFQWTGTTWAGDVLLNNQYAPGPAAQGGYDLFTLALHEAGHVFGFPVNDDVASVLYGNYTGPFTSLPAQDVARLQALYGPRTPDAYDAVAPNDTAATATNLGPILTGTWVAGDVTTNQDVDYYKVIAPGLLGLTGLTIKLQTRGLSLLAPYVTVYDAAGNVCGSGTAADPGGNTLTITANSPRLLNSVYYVKVSGATQDVFGIGGYKLGVSFQVGGLDLGDPLAAVFVDDGHTNDTLGSATDLTGSGNNADARFDYLYRGKIRDQHDTDFYKIQAPATPAVALTGIVWRADPNGLAPVMHLFDAAGHGVPLQVVTDAQGIYTVQAENLLANGVYYLEVAALDPQGDHATGNYVMGVDFVTNALVNLDRMGSATLSQGVPTDTASLVLQDARLFHFNLAAQGSGGDDDVTMTVTDANGQTVLSLSAAAGQEPVTATLYLGAGTYTVTFTAHGGADGVILPLTYFLAGALLSDNSGPYYTGGNGPPPPPPPPGGTYTYNLSPIATALYSKPYYF
jgi:hypothetical protein